MASALSLKKFSSKFFAPRFLVICYLRGGTLQRAQHIWRVFPILTGFFSKHKEPGNPWVGGECHTWSVTWMKLGVNVTILTYFHVVRSPRDEVELVGSNTMCQCGGFPRKLHYSSLRQLWLFTCTLAKAGCKAKLLLPSTFGGSASQLGPWPVWNHRMASVGRGLQRSSSPTCPAVNMDIFH